MESSFAEEIYKGSALSTNGKVFKMFDTQIPLAVKAAESSRMGESILSYDKNSNVSKSYIELAKEVLNDERIRKKARNSNELQFR